MDLSLRFSAKRFFAALAAVLVLDAVWLSLAVPRIYPAFKNVRVGFGLLAWVPFALALSLGKTKTTGEAALFGAGVGFVAYAVFNGTELAIREDWRASPVAAFDLLWGTALGAAAATITSFV